MSAALKLKAAPNVLAYEWLSDAPGTVSASRTRAELIADCDARSLTAFKAVFEQASTDEAWATLTNVLTPTVVPGMLSRTQLTAKFESVDGVQQMTVSGKTWGIANATVEVRPK